MVVRIRDPDEVLEGLYNVVESLNRLYKEMDASPYKIPTPFMDDLAFVHGMVDDLIDDQFVTSEYKRVVL